MTKLTLLRCVVFFLLASPVYGQKVKYKDIWGLLSTKQYEAAEPFLKKYLQENTDNPNAFLYMGIVYQEKSLKDDVLKRTPRVISAMDSSILYYDKAYKTITEKEVKRNSEFYQAYNRRDLRTGEFGVKLSDIQFDLEKKIEGLRERIDRVKMVKHYFSLSDSLYRKSNRLYRSIQAAYPGQKELYLRADKGTLQNLALLASRFDSCTKAFDNYRSSAATIGRTGYNHTLSLDEIRNFKNDGASLANYYQDDLKLWDYKQFAAQTIKVIETEIMPMRDHLVAYDIEINKLREKLNHDSLSVKNDLTSLIDKLLMEQLRKYDQEPLPMEIFTLKIADLEYRSAVLEHKSNPDTTNVHLRLGMLNRELKYLNKLDSMAAKLSGADLEAKAADYAFFVENTYSSTAVLKSFVGGLKEYAEREKKIKALQLARYNDALKWLVVGSDSIPLSREGRGSAFKPLIVVDEKYTAGIHYPDSLNPAGYLYSINPSRIPDVKVSFPVEKQSFRQARLSASRAVSFSDAAGQIYFVLIFSERSDKDNKFPATLAKIYRSDGLAWSMNYQLDFIPREISFRADSGELTINGGTNQQNTMDKNGKVIR